MKKYYGPFLACIFGLAVLASACVNGDETSAGGGAEAMEDEAMEETEGGAMEDGAMEETEDGGPGHGHGDGVEVPDGMAVPQISIEAKADPATGHNLFIELEDFEVAPERASTEPVEGEGHMHLYIDGERTMRFYNQALHIDGLSEGDHKVTVEISANNHAAYVVDGEPIRATTTITVEETESHGGDKELFEPESAPTVAVTVTEDPKSGWNLFVETSNFVFSPESAGGEATAGQGHLHLLIDGEKVGRLYGPSWHIANLDPGAHEIAVEVVADDHSPYGVNGQAISAATTVEVTEDSDDTADDKAEDHADDHAGDAHGGSGATLDLGPGEADVNVEVSIVDNSVEVENRRVKVEQGSTVGVMITSDLEEMLHIHGYDLLVTIGPDGPAHVSFLADSPGVFEVELEDSQRFVFEIEVS